MTDHIPDDRIARIERAASRIETAATARAFAADSIGRRHAALRQRTEEAAKALDALIAREDAGGAGDEGDRNA